MKVVVLEPPLDRGRIVTIDALDSTTERHRIDIPSGGEPVPVSSVRTWLGEHPDVRGAVMSLNAGVPGRVHLGLGRWLLASGYAAWFFWPTERAVERIDDERLRSAWLHWLAVKGWQSACSLIRRPAWPAGRLSSIADAADLLEMARPVPLRDTLDVSDDQAITGPGVYLRTDFWAAITSGGSYGHTCYVARELARTTRRFVAFIANRYPLLDDMGIQQVVIESPSATASELDLLRATPHFEARLRPALEALKPAYIYERLCLGNLAGARLSRSLGIPYIVEYNGSELSMRRSFQGEASIFELEFEMMEAAAFAQATIISVVSDVIKDDLVKRGVDPAKILVNPNGVDPQVYAPPAAAERDAIRGELGWTPADRVVCFTGTFGGWHGIDVLSEALPVIAERASSVKFLLIGDGTHRALVETAVRDAHLEARVHMSGRVPQQEGARLMKAADIFVSPHSSHMIDSPFFGSPTKLFEYMACGGGIVASDLEQIGQVMRPALRPTDFAQATPSVTDQRGVLCEPGDVPGFVEAVCALAREPQIAAALGANAQRAAQECFSWEAHVRRLWSFAAGDRSAAPFAPRPGDVAGTVASIQTGDPYKDQVQHQWNNNPVGSHYAKQAPPHTVDWFLEVEAHRYGEYGPWMPRLMEFDRHRGERVLEVGGGMGTDLAQFARNGAIVTDVDLSAGHLDLARENFRLRGLTGTFIHHDAEMLPFPDGTFDVVYSNGVIHHTPNTQSVIDEIYRVLKPGGKAIIMVYAEHSLNYWSAKVAKLGLRGGLLQALSMGDIMSRAVEMTRNNARPLVKVYTARRLRKMFASFSDVHIHKRQLTAPELPAALRWVPLGVTERIAGWNLIVKARRPKTGK